ncbi:endospore germination permease [Solibacillus sp. MA9]|uniref:Endospore germination permease n=1 Tax=Solibacillus palustris TaxID=2908203 RepID=A0ABS9U8J8_9BACL|nr:endospore germination permease [Solibacillus sp. MA9]MCH7320475.1 endospore germination permease [Solibacillus sp. MA9]
MMQDVKINPYQFLVLVILFTIGSSILTVPSALATDAKQDAWIAAIIGTGIGLLVIWLFITIALWFPHLTYVQIIEKLFGRWIGKAFATFFVFISLLFASELLYYFGIFLNIHMMPNTPMIFLNLLMIGIVVMGVRLGLETFARTAEILIVVFFVFFFILVVCISPEMKFENIQPVYEMGTKKILQSSIFYVIVSSVDAIVLLMIFPSFVNKMKQGKKIFLIGNLIGGIVIIVITFLCVTVLGFNKTAEEIYPSYELTKKISIGNFIQRIEGLMASLWVITLYFKTTLYFYASVLGMAQILNLKDYRPLTLPLGMIAVVLSLVIYPNIIYQKHFDDTTGNSLTLSIGLFLPLLLVVVYAIRKRTIKKEVKINE